MFGFVEATPTTNLEFIALSESILFSQLTTLLLVLDGSDSPVWGYPCLHRRTFYIAR